MAFQVIATNRKAFRNFHIEDKWECGIVLVGGEVKSVREGRVNFKDSFAMVDGHEVFLHNFDITSYEKASYMNPRADRPRKLLLHRKEILKLSGYVDQRGMSLVPTRVYINARGLVKIELGLGRGKKLYDKRETIKKRDIERALKRTLRVRRGR